MQILYLFNVLDCLMLISGTNNHMTNQILILYITLSDTDLFFTLLVSTTTTKTTSIFTKFSATNFMFGSNDIRKQEPRFTNNTQRDFLQLGQILPQDTGPSEQGFRNVSRLHFAY